MTDEQKPNHAFARSLSNAGLGLPTMEALYEFLRKHRKHSRFEGRNNKEWGFDTSQRIAKMHMEDLEKYGEDLISIHESMSGQEVKFDRNLKILNLDAPPVEHQIRRGNYFRERCF